MIEQNMYHIKLYHCVFLIFFIAAVVIGLSYRLQPTQFITSAKATSEKMPASDLSVVGKPSLPAATVNTILKNLGSPMSGTGQVIEQASKQTNIDDAFALAVWWTETNDGAAGVGLADRNPGSVRGSIGYPSAFDGYTIYPSYSAAIIYWFNMLKSMYVNHGLNTVYLISYPYVGTSSSPLWAGKVVALMLKYRGEAPPLPIVVTNGKRGSGPSVYIHSMAVYTLHMQQLQNRIESIRKSRSSLLVKQVNTTSTSSATTNAIVFFALVLALAIVVCVLWLEKQSKYKAAHVQAYDATIQVENPQDRHSHDAVIPGENFRIQGKLFLPSIPKVDPAKLDGSAVTRSLGVRSTGLLSRYGETRQG